MGRRKRGWNAAAGLSLADLRRLVDEKMAQVDKLSERRAELAAELDEIDAELATAGANDAVTTRRRRGPGRPPKRGRRGPGRPPKARRGPGRPPKKVGRPKGRKRVGARGPRGEGGLQSMIRQVLAEAKEPMKLKDLAQTLLDKGYKTSSKRFGIIVGQRLSAMSDVKKAGRGMYALK